MGDCATPAGAGKTADKNVVSRGAQFDAHLQGAEGAFLADQVRHQLRFSGGLERNRRGIATPPQLFGGQPGEQI